MKPLFLLLVSIMFVACHSRTEKAKTAIQEKLKLTVNDWDSYEAVKWGELDSCFTRPEDDDPLYISYLSDMTSAFEQSKMYGDMARDAQNDAGAYGEVAEKFSAEFNKTASEERMKGEELLDTLDAIKKRFKPVFKGWHIAHSWRINDDSTGRKVLKHHLFCLDKNLKPVNAQEISESWYEEKGDDWFEQKQ